MPGSLGRLSVGVSGERQPCRGQAHPHQRPPPRALHGVPSESPRRYEGPVPTPSPAVNGFPRKRPLRY